MESFLNVKSLMDVKVVLFIVWIIMIFTSAEEERKYAKVRDRENFDTFNGTHVIILGHRREGDRLLMWHHAADCGRILRKASEVIEYPGTGYGAIIHQINLTNLIDEGKATITAGGVSQTFVHITVLATRLGGSYNFFVQVFGEPKTVDTFDFRAYATEHGVEWLNVKK